MGNGVGFKKQQQAAKGYQIREEDPHDLDQSHFGISLLCPCKIAAHECHSFFAVNTARKTFCAFLQFPVMSANGKAYETRLESDRFLRVLGAWLTS